MLGAMLIGAWLLIHQCCAIGEKESKMRSSFLVEQLTRRSNLENNFMRFGRSSGFNFEPQELTKADVFPNGVKRAKDSSNYFRLGRAKTMRDNFIRFGKRDEQTFEKPAEQNTKFSEVPDSDDFNRAMRGGNDGFARTLDDFYRPIRAKTDFMRFGRSEDKKKKLKENLKLRFGRDTEFNRDVRGRTDFMRFGRDANNHREEIVANEEKRSLPWHIQDQSSQDKHEQSGTTDGNGDLSSRGVRSEDKHNEPVATESIEDFNEDDKHDQIITNEEKGWRLCSDDESVGKKVCRTANTLDHMSRLGRSLPSPFQTGFILGPEFALLPPIYYKKNNRNSVNNMMRLG